MEQEQLEVEGCGYLCVHEELVAQVQSALPDDDTLSRLTDLFKAFADGTRIRILYVLFEAEVCVCDLARLLGMTQSAVSHQLRILRQTKIVKSRRSGKEVYYSLDDEHISKIYRMALDHLHEERNG